MADQATTLSLPSAAINHQLLEDIKAILIERPTYGYRRVTAILNASVINKVFFWLITSAFTD
jgi:hypothetical protein